MKIHVPNSAFIGNIDPFLRGIDTSEPNKLYADPFKDKHSTSENIPLWQGTVVGVDISLNATQEFSRLLELIRGVYAKTIRERKHAKYRKPTFI
jgi:hypothetical protein